MAQKKELNGTWTYCGKLPKDASGKNRYYKKRGFKTKRDAKSAEASFLESLKKIPVAQMTLNDVIKEYHKDAPTLLKESTLKSYIRIERDMIVPTFGNKYLKDITSLEVSRWINDIYFNGVNGKKYSDETVKGILLHLSGLMTYAVKHDWLIKNPCYSVKRPKNPNEKLKEKSSVNNYWEIEEYEEFMEYVEDDLRYDIYEFTFYTGLRLGELCSLQYRHVNFEQGTVTVEQSLSSITSKITSPKTGNSYRTIKVPSKVMNKIKTRYDYLRLLRGFNNKWFVFGDQKYVSNGTIRRWFNDDVRKSGVKVITFHGLRHSHASYLLANPLLSEQLIADRLGHTVKTLRDTYYHVYKKHRTALDEFINDL